MKSSLYILTLFIGLGCVTSAERRVNGSEGESVEIQCNYPDGYRYKEKYWCRHPCGNKDVLIKTGKTDTVVTVGRFSLYDNVSIRTFTVTMSRLTLQDTGVYYCGLEQWGTDGLSKIHLRVRKAPTVPTVTPSAPGSVTEEVTATALTASSSQDTASSTTVDLDRCRSVFRLSIGLPCVFILTSIVIAVEIITRLNSCRGKRSAAQSDGQREVTGDTAMKMAEAAGGRA